MRAWIAPPSFRSTSCRVVADSSVFPSRPPSGRHDTEQHAILHANLRASASNSRRERLVDLRYSAAELAYRDKVRSTLRSLLPADWAGYGALSKAERDRFGPWWRD